MAGTIGFSMAAALAMAVALVGARTITGEALPVVIELAILILFGAGTYAAVVLAFRPRTLRTFWVLVAEK